MSIRYSSSKVLTAYIQCAGPILQSLLYILHAYKYEDQQYLKPSLASSLRFKECNKKSSQTTAVSVTPTCANHQAISGHLVFLLSGGTFLRTLNRRQFHLCLYQPRKKGCQIPTLKCILIAKRKVWKYCHFLMILQLIGSRSSRNCQQNLLCKVSQLSSFSK